MTVEDIFSQLVAHTVEGLMVHAQMAEYYDFLGLKGYAKCHTYHYFLENCNYRKMCEYYIGHYEKLPIDTAVGNPKIIPDSWYKYTRRDVDTSTRKTSIAAGIEKWVTWEKNTKKIYEQLYQELINLNEIAGAMELKKYIKDVNKELADAQLIYVKKKAIDYNISDIMAEQDEMCKKYDKKLQEMNVS